MTPGRHGGRAAQDIGPVRRDERLLDLAANQPLEFYWAGTGIEEVQALGWQVTNARNELEAQQGGDREDMVCEAAGVSVLLADILASIGHQQTVKNVGCLVHRGRDGLGGERTKLVGDMGVGLQPGFAAIFGVDQVHRLSLTCCREELAVARRCLSGAPEPGHRQVGLSFDHFCQRSGQCFALDMPA